MTRISRRGFVVSLLALGVTAGLPLPIGVRPPTEKIVSGYVGIPSAGPIDFIRMYDEIGKTVVADARHRQAIMHWRSYTSLDHVKGIMVPGPFDYRYEA